MNTLRRAFLRMAGALGTVVAGLAFDLLAPLRAVAVVWNQSGFDSKALADALESIGATTSVESPDILIKAPDVAENGAIVPIEVVSRISNTRFIAILAEKNPFPLVGTFTLRDGAEGFVSTRVKLGQTSPVRVIVKAEDKIYRATREVTVTVGGCGA
jgi:sulfur-oxidizing protein SoxY